ncbi:MAG: type II toxin-antitoxin system HicA family toxin [Ignavibacteriales bacterium]|nr:type II toxin-antitoxin system HicA family toxin [Ignavibacteriales bacterium]
MINANNYQNNNVSFGMKYKEVVKLAKQQGCEFVRHGKGDHDIFQRKAKGGVTLEGVLPHHNHDIRESTLKSFCKQLGIKI